MYINVHTIHSYYITLINTEASRLTKLIEKKCNNCEKDAVALCREDNH